MSINGINQWTPELVDTVMESIAVFNSELFPLSILLPLFLISVTVGLIYYCYKEPGNKSSNYLKLFLAFVYVISGLHVFVGALFGVMPLPVALIGLSGMWVVSLLLLMDIYWNKTSFDFTLSNTEYKPVKITGFALMFTGIVVYPIVEILTGFIWPDIVFFMAECPTTIFLIGLLLTAIPKTNKLLILLIGINAVYTGTSVALMGFPTDLLYAIAGITGIIAMAVYWREITFSFKTR